MDTSVILEPEKTEDGRFCKRYMQIVSYKFRGKFSLLVFGETLLSIMSLRNYRDQHDSLDHFLRLVSVRKIETYVPKKIEETMMRIREIDYRIDPTDTEILSCAIEDGARILVTLDTKLIHNERIENEFGIEIKHPKELL